MSHFSSHLHSNGLGVDRNGGDAWPRHQAVFLLNKATRQFSRTEEDILHSATEDMAEASSVEGKWSQSKPPRCGTVKYNYIQIRVIHNNIYKTSLLVSAFQLSHHQGLAEISNLNDCKLCCAWVRFVRVFVWGEGAEQLSRYSDSQLAGRSGDQIPVRARFFEPAQTGPGAHPASHIMDTGSPFRR